MRFIRLVYIFCKVYVGLLYFGTSCFRGGGCRGQGDGEDFGV